MSGQLPGEERFCAFISYSHRDHAVARWLHRGIESFRFPKSVIGSETPFGVIGKKLPPVFKDRDELPASGDLGSELRAALYASRFQIVICSPEAAKSHWVNEEILIFKRHHGEGRTLALIASGEPHSADERECFPPALMFRVGQDGSLTDEPAEPIAADIRSGMDGRRLALQKLLAGISGVRLDSLVQRDNARRQKRMMAYMAASTAIALVTLGLAVFAESQRRVAVAQRDLAESSLEFLTNTFEIANPATENPRTITALTILDRASDRALSRFEDRPQVAARLLRTTGDIYFNLGLLEESERDLAKALELEPDKGAGRATILLKLALLARKRGDVVRLEELVGLASNAYDEGDDGAEVIDAMVAKQRGNIAYLQADYVEAARRYARAVSLYSELEGDYRSEIGAVLMEEAQARVQAYQYDRADRLYRRAATIYAEKFGSQDVNTARVLHNQALANLLAEKPGLAIPKMARALDIYERVLDPAHPNLAAARLLMGRIYTAEGDYRSALSSFDEARAIFTALYGADNPAVGDTDFYAAEAAAGAGRITQALGLADNVKRIYDAAYGTDDPDQAELFLLKSRIFEHAGNRTSAFRECRKALNLQRKIQAAKQTLARTEELCSNFYGQG